MQREKGRHNSISKSNSPFICTTLPDTVTNSFIGENVKQIVVNIILKEETASYLNYINFKPCMYWIVKNNI